MGIGGHIGELLKERNKSAAWLARETRIPATTIRTWISKDKDSISFRQLAVIARVLNCSMQDLLPEVPIQAMQLDWWISQKRQLINSLFSLSDIDYDVDPFEGEIYIRSEITKRKYKLTSQDEDHLMEQTVNYFEFEVKKLLDELETREEK